MISLKLLRMYTPLLTGLASGALPRLPTLLTSKEPNVAPALQSKYTPKRYSQNTKFEAIRSPRFDKI